MPLGFMFTTLLVIGHGVKPTLRHKIDNPKLISPERIASLIWQLHMEVNDTLPWG